jgi:hypothetical protein
MGRPRKYTPEEAKARTAANKRVYKHRMRELAVSHIARPCCRDWARAGTLHGARCPQHRTWQEFSHYRVKVEWTRNDYEEFARLLDDFCAGDAKERNFAFERKAAEMLSTKATPAERYFINLFTIYWLVFRYLFSWTDYRPELFSP